MNKEAIEKAAKLFAKKKLVFTDELKDYDERLYHGFLAGATHSEGSEPTVEYLDSLYERCNEQIIQGSEFYQRGFQDRGSYQGKWISVEERKPTDSEEEVLVYAPDCKIIGQVLIGRYFKPERGFPEAWTVYDFHESTRATVTHWRPLPQAPTTKSTLT